MQVRRLLLHSAFVIGFAVMSTFVVAQDATGSAQTSAGSAQQSGDMQQKSGDAEHKGKAKGAKGGMDKRFVMEAAEGGLAEVQLGNVAKQNGSNDAVKSFGDRMVNDHGTANSELQQLAQQKGWTLPTELKEMHKKHSDQLSTKQGAEFDKMYMQMMVKDHQKDVRAFQRCAQSCTDPDLKAWAAKTVPTLQEHLKQAQQVAQQVGASTGKGAAKAGKKSGEKSGVSNQ